MKLIAVIGGHLCTPEEAELAMAVGQRLAMARATLICGGGGGVMEAACRGARGAGGHTIGILPGEDPEQANEFVEFPLATGLGGARNVILILSAWATIAIGGEGGTLSEIGYALRLGKPVVSLHSWDPAMWDGERPAGILLASTADEAVKLALEVASAPRGYADLGKAPEATRPPLVS
ncbi:MAG: TIGR00725 family protein [Anaerolineales bacterium]|jgi:uncharacterized protein (TIGR00725 family)